MKTITNKRLIELIQHEDAGGIVQCSTEFGDWGWVNKSPEEGWNTIQFSYRKKPQPMELWFNVFKDGFKAFYDSEQDALNAVVNRSKYARIAVYLKEPTDGE